MKGALVFVVATAVLCGLSWASLHRGVLCGECCLCCRAGRATEYVYTLITDDGTELQYAPALVEAIRACNNGLVNDVRMYLTHAFTHPSLAPMHPRL